MYKYLLLFAITFISNVSLFGKENVSIKLKGLKSDQNVVFLSEDLRSLFSKASNDNEYNISLVADSKFKNGEFGYKSKGNKIEIFGGDLIGVSNGVYTLLEKIGYTFDITGTSYPEVYDMEAIVDVDTLIIPKIRYRGIRQHVNFPMDISSYNIDQAKEYVDNLVRLRFNKLAIHSYPGQWYEAIGEDGKPEYAGHFFYGDKHYITNNDIFKKYIPENDSLFCIPQAESLHSDPAALSKAAIEWMQSLVSYAKSKGIYIQFSIEPRSSDIERVKYLTNLIYKTYPQIDALELITEETGGWGAHCTDKDVHDALNKYFDSDIASNKEVTECISKSQGDLAWLYTQIGANSKAIKDLSKDMQCELKLGIYCSVTKYSKGAFRLARLALPDTKITLLSSHGSIGVSKAIPEIVKSDDDYNKTEIYSWIEFDGLMYVMQNSIRGNEDLHNTINNSVKGQYGSLLYNHWRTAENRTPARYVAESSISGVTSAHAFYNNYAQRMGIEDKSTYESCMRDLNEADAYSTGALGNIGFCWVGAWKSGGSFTWMSKQNILHADSIYKVAGAKLETLIKQPNLSKEAKNYLLFLGNRTLCSILYLKAFAEATEIRTIKKLDDGSVTPDEQKRALEICDHALLIFDQYMKTHAIMMPDRGCQGTLASVWAAPIRGLKVLRSKLGGAEIDMLPQSKGPIDAPPLPIFYENLK